MLNRHQRVRLTSQLCLPFWSKLQTTFTYPTANPGKKSGEPCSLERVNFLVSSVHLRQVMDFGKAKPSQKFFPKPYPYSPQEQIAQTMFEKGVVWKNKQTKIPAVLLTFSRRALQLRLQAREWEPWLFGYSWIVLALRNVQKSCPTLLGNKKQLQSAQCLLFFFSFLKRQALLRKKKCFICVYYYVFEIIALLYIRKKSSHIQCLLG